MKRTLTALVWVLALGGLVFLGWYLGLSGKLSPRSASEMGAGAKTGRGPIVIGGLMDTTGATSDVCLDYSMGMEEAFRYINDNGGVRGRTVAYIWFDYGYRVQEAFSKYRMLKRQGALAIMGWGTGDTEALALLAAEDKTPYVSASSSPVLTLPQKAPYNVFFAPDYGSCARAALTAWYEKHWPLNPDSKKRKPRLAAVYQFSSPYAASGIKALKDHAALLEIEVSNKWDQDLSLFAFDAKSQVEALLRAKPDVIWHGNTTQSVAATLRDAKAAGLSADFIVNNWGFDENLPALAGPAAEGVMGVTPCGFFAQDFPLMDKVREYARRHNPGTPLEKRLIRTVQAWANALMLAEALKRADEAGPLTGENIMSRGFLTMKNFDIGLGAAPVSFSALDHRPTGVVMVQEWRSGAFKPVGRVDVKSRWPEQWKKGWHGW